MCWNSDSLCSLDSYPKLKSLNVEFRQPKSLNVEFRQLSLDSCLKMCWNVRFFWKKNRFFGVDASLFRRKEPYEERGVTCSACLILRLRLQMSCGLEVCWGVGFCEFFFKVSHSRRTLDLKYLSVQIYQFSGKVFWVTGIPFTQLKTCVELWGLPWKYVWCVWELLWKGVRYFGSRDSFKPDLLRR